MTSWLASIVGGSVPEPAPQHTHCLPPFSDQSICGLFVDADQHGESPSCPDCQRLLAEDEAERRAEIEERYPTRRLSIYERHELAADHGCDSWEEMRGER